MKVSAKGQVVIPAIYRERLGIEPGTEVNVRIRGQFLIIEIDTDVTADIEFLSSLKGQLGEKDFDMTSAQEICRDLLCQQFYQGNDILTDRVGKVTIKIRGSDSIINESIKIMTQASRHWLDGNYVETIREFADIFDLDFPALLSKFVTTLNNMLPGGDMSMIEMMGGEVVYSMAVGSTLTLFREKVGDMVTERLSKRAEELGYVKKLGRDTVHDLVTRSLAEKYSILMNLRTLRELARMSVKSVGQRFFSKFSEEMLMEYQEYETPEHVIKRRERTLRRRLQRARQEGRDVDQNELKRELGLDLVEKKKKKKRVEEEEDEELAVPDLPSFDF